MDNKQSIIVPTYNGSKRIITLLKALNKQSVTDFELIVVIDGSSDNTAEIVEPYLSQFYSSKIIHQNNQGRSSARNRGAIESLGATLIFFDDDMEPFCDSVERHLNFHKNNSGLLCGHQTENESAEKTDIQNYKAFLTKEWTKKYSGDLNRLNLANLFFTGANCSMTRNAFEQLKGFDERLTDAEDYDFAYRAIKQNIPVFFDQRNLAVHNDPITCVSYVKRIRQYERAQQKLIELHPDRENRRVTPSAFNHLAYRFLAFNFLPHALH